MHNILLEIIEKKRKNLEIQKKKISLEKFKEKILEYRFVANNSFKNKILGTNDIAIIAEIKLASPTIKSLGKKNKILDRVLTYQKAGADAISFITEKNYFKGGVNFISKLKNTVLIPVFQKDFIIDEYQIYEAKAIGSDALLLIVRFLDLKLLNKFVTICLEIGIEPVVEINSKEDLEKAVKTKTNFIAVNARNLEDFIVDVDKACKLMEKIPNQFNKLGFSGVHNLVEVKKYKKAGARGILVGTELMKAGNIEEFIQSLRENL